MLSEIFLDLAPHILHSFSRTILGRKIKPSAKAFAQPIFQRFKPRGGEYIIPIQGSGGRLEGI